MTKEVQVFVVVLVVCFLVGVISGVVALVLTKPPKFNPDFPSDYTMIVIIGVPLMLGVLTARYIVGMFR